MASMIICFEVNDEDYEEAVRLLDDGYNFALISIFNDDDTYDNTLTFYGDEGEVVGEFNVADVGVGTEEDE